MPYACRQALTHTPLSYHTSQMKLGAALQLYGSPVPRTEALLAALAAELNVDGCVRRKREGRAWLDDVDFFSKSSLNPTAPFFHSQFYFLQDLLLCSFGADSSCTEMHMVPCPQASVEMSIHSMRERMHNVIADTLAHRCAKQDDDFDAFRYRKTSHLVRRLLEGGSEESPDDASPAAADVDPHWQRHIRPITLPQAIAKVRPRRWGWDLGIGGVNW